MADKKQFIEYYRNNGKTHSWSQLAEMFHFASGDALRKFAFRNKNYFKLEDVIVQEQQGSGNPILTEHDIHRETGNEVLTFQSNKPLSPEEIDDLAQVDNKTRVVTRTWLKSNKNNIWTYSICTKLIEKPEESTVDFKQEFEDFVNSRIEDKKKTKKVGKAKLEKTDNALILSLSDLHIDKKSYYEETGDESSLFNQSMTAFEAAVDIIERATLSHSIETIYIIGGNDFFHANSAANTTKKGTPLDVDSRWNKSFKEGLSLISDIIDYATQFARVEYITVLGNHSPERELYLSIALEAYYRNDENVKVETVNNVRKYFRYGNSAFMLSHEFGNKEKDLPVIFAVESPKDFAECKYKFILSGHIHSKKETMFVGAHEQYGILHKVMPSLSSTDLWHHENLFIGNQKSCIGLVINSKYGEIAEIVYNV